MKYLSEMVEKLQTAKDHDESIIVGQKREIRELRRKIRNLKQENMSQSTLTNPKFEKISISSQKQYRKMGRVKLRNEKELGRDWIVFKDRILATVTVPGPHFLTRHEIRFYDSAGRQESSIQLDFQPHLLAVDLEGGLIATTGGTPFAYICFTDVEFNSPWTELGKNFQQFKQFEGVDFTVDSEIVGRDRHSKKIVIFKKTKNGYEQVKSFGYRGLENGGSVCFLKVNSQKEIFINVGNKLGKYDFDGKLRERSFDENCAEFYGICIDGEDRVVVVDDRMKVTVYNSHLQREGQISAFFENIPSEKLVRAWGIDCDENYVFLGVDTNEGGFVYIFEMK